MFRWKSIIKIMKINIYEGQVSAIKVCTKDSEIKSTRVDRLWMEQSWEYWSSLIYRNIVCDKDENNFSINSIGSAE